MTNYFDLLNVVLFPEFFDPITYKISYLPSHTTKQKYILYKNVQEGVIVFYPGINTNELMINMDQYQIMKNKQFMDKVHICACSIIIYADIIIVNKNVYKNEYRTIYQPINEFKMDENTKMVIEFKNLRQIKIYRHVQFIPYQEYNEIFIKKQSVIDKENIEKFYNYLNLYKYA